MQPLCSAAPNVVQKSVACLSRACEWEPYRDQHPVSRAANTVGCRLKLLMLRAGHAPHARKLAWLIAEIARATGEGPVQTNAHPVTLAHLWLRGDRVALPCRGAGRHLSDQKKEEVQYSAGFFDGAGQVVKDTAGYRLELTLPLEQQAAILLFLDLYGGTALRSSNVKLVLGIFSVQ